MRSSKTVNLDLGCLFHNNKNATIYFNVSQIVCLLIPIGIRRIVQLQKRVCSRSIQQLGAIKPEIVILMKAPYNSRAIIRFLPLICYFQRGLLGLPDVKKTMSYKDRNKSNVSQVIT